MEGAIARVVRGAIEDRVFPGCVVGVVWKNGDRVILPFGRYGYESSSRRVTEDSIFDVASITKSIPTSCLALRLVDRGKLHLDDPVITYIPELENIEREHIALWHLLTHTLDFHLQLSSLKDKVSDEILNIIFSAELKSKPGEKYAYINATSILLGIVIERATSKKLDEFSEELFFGPLGMSRTTFHPESFARTEIVPTEIDDWRGRMIQGEVHDESAFALRKKYVVGSAGLFSTAQDLLTFLSMLLQKGSYKGRRYFSEKIIEQMYVNQLGKLSVFGGLGWDLYQTEYMGQYCTKETFGKTGFTGCVVMCDLTKEVGIVVLSNYNYPHRKFDNLMRNKVFSAIAGIIFSHKA